MTYIAEFKEDGGYNCMSDAWFILDEKGNLVCAIDLADYRVGNEAEIVARTIAQRLSQ